MAIQKSKNNQITSFIINCLGMLALLLSFSAKATLISAQADVTDGSAAIGFQEFIPEANPRAVNNTATIRTFTQVFATGPAPSPVASSWILNFTATRSSDDNGPEQVILQLFTFNNTGVNWRAAELTLGMGDTFNNFMTLPSLSILDAPETNNQGAIFTAGPIWQNPPTISNDNNAFWNNLVDPATGGLASGLDTLWQLSISIPDSKFLPDNNNESNEIAQFSVRLTTYVPAPSSIPLLALGILTIIRLSKSHKTKTPL